MLISPSCPSWKWGWLTSDFPTERGSVTATLLDKTALLNWLQLSFLHPVSLFQLATIADTIEHVFPVLGGFHALRGVINSVNSILCVNPLIQKVLTLYISMTETEWNLNCDPFCSSVDYQEVLYWDFSSWALECLRRRCGTTHTYTHTHLYCLSLRQTSEGMRARKHKKTSQVSSLCKWNVKFWSSLCNMQKNVH